MNNKMILASLNWGHVQFSMSDISNINSLLQVDPVTDISKILCTPKLTENFWNNKTWLKKQEFEHRWLEKRRIQILAPWEQNYPVELKNIKYPPFLSVIGSVHRLNQDSLAVVGSRVPSQVSISWMRSEFSDFLSNTNAIVVSGGARGVDQEAHRLCIAQKNPTICFLPSGLAKVYPAEILKWFDSIVQCGGAIVSQFSPFTQIYKSHFHKRNELIAAISSSTFVVEARLRSGSLLTSTKAMELGREIATLPCSPGAPSGKGNLKLLGEGAQMIGDSQDLQTFYNRNLRRPLSSHF